MRAIEESTRASPYSPAPATPEVVQLRVLVVSDQPLVADAVRTALNSQSLDAVGATMPRALMSRRQVTRLLQLGPEVVLLLADLTRGTRLTAARSLIENLRLPTVVLSATEDEALWGAVLESGATAVLPASATLDQTVGVLRGVCAGMVAVSPRRREEMVRLWRHVDTVRSDLAARISSLSPREFQVLSQLYRGETVAAIAKRSEVSVATVRSQVRSVRRKLAVGSQLAAVADYARWASSRPEDDST